jgi:very-short-patch-repair endonuclease
VSNLGSRVLSIAALNYPRRRKLALLAEKQHEVVARWQLALLGFTRHEIQHLVRQGVLHRLFPGVFTVGSRHLTREGRWMAAVLACGEKAVLSHRSAIALWGLRPPRSGAIDVTDPTRCHFGQPGIKVHRTRCLDPEDRAIRTGIPVTSVHRAILDFAETAPAQQVRLAIEMADRKELYDGYAMDELLARSPGRKGTKPLKAILNAMRGQTTPLTRSQLENRLLAGMRDADICEPQADVLIEGELVDFVWVEQRLVLEVDSYLWHNTRKDFESNRRRDTRLQLAGFRVIRATEQRIWHELDGLLIDLKRMLVSARRPGDP